MLDAMNRVAQRHGLSARLYETAAGYRLMITNTQFKAGSADADALGLASFDLLGHSMGGMAARRLVLQHPDRVGALVLMDDGGQDVPFRHVPVVDFARDGIVCAVVDALHQLLP